MTTRRLLSSTLEDDDHSSRNRNLRRMLGPSLVVCMACALPTATAFAFYNPPPVRWSTTTLATTPSLRQQSPPRRSLPSSSSSSSRSSPRSLLVRNLHRTVAAEEGRNDTSSSSSVLATTAVPSADVASAATAAMESSYSYKNALLRTMGWVAASMVFGGAVWTFCGPEIGEEFFAGYLVEQSLSVDNLFVFLLLFEYFKVPLAYQDRVLNWGIYGAVVMRAVMISMGAVALQNFHEILLVFAAILVYSSAKIFVGDDDEDDDDPANNSIVRLAHSLFDSTEEYDGDRFFTVAADGVRKATPLLICMVAVEISDVVFAVDSIPAVFGVTENPLVVFSSNLFAIMGLRSLYTILSQAATDLKYLEPAVALVLGFIGSKMIGEYCGVYVPTAVALGVVATLLTGGVALSVWERSRSQQQQ